MRQSWIVDDTGFPKKGKHSVGVARQYCGQLGKQDNGQVGVSLSVATEESSLPIALRLFLPEPWAEDAQRRKQAHIPREIGLATKPDIALAQISQALDAGGAPGVVLADAGYGNGSEFRDALRSRSLTYAVGIQSTTTVYGALAAGAMERRQRASAQAIATHCRPCAAVRTRLGHGTGRPRLETGEVAARHQDRTGFALRRRAGAQRPSGLQASHPSPMEWLLIEWPRQESEPIQYWLSNLPGDTKLQRLVHTAKMRWRIERDYQELKQEFG
jgi:SRSO17 transposase